MVKSLLYAAFVGGMLLGWQNASGATNEDGIHRVDKEKVNVTKFRAAAGDNESEPGEGDAPEETWKSIGEATWVEGPADGYASSVSGKRWKVNVEESEATPGRYRMIPYGAGSALSDALWFDCDEYFYVNAQDPEKVWCEDYSHILFVISQLVPENGWQEVAIYGTLKDHIVTFPEKSFGVSDDGKEPWAYSNTGGNFTIFLPGAVVTDYSFDADIDICAEDGNVAIECKSGSSVAAVKLKVFEGEVEINDAIWADVAANGEEISANGETSWTAPAEGRYTACAVALDENGEVQGSDWGVVFYYDDDADNWESMGNGTFTDPVFSALDYNSSLLNDPQTYEVAVEKNKNNAALIRIVDPYVNHPFFVKQKRYLVSHGHHHYIFMDTTDPEFIFVAESPLGIDLGGGHICINSPATRYIKDHPKDDIKKYYGSVVLKDGVITFESQSLFVSEAETDDNALYRTDAVGKLVLPTVSGIKDAIAGDESEVKYYNLQGIEVTAPQAGQIVIRKQGQTTAKIVVR